MSDTLVIHPEDETTIMLKYVYEGKGFDVINNPNISKADLRRAIECHDRIIILGHGMGLGLAHPNSIHFHQPGPDGSFFIIDGSFASLLKSKNTISMWCNSDVYFRRYGITGFHTGMIISERDEAYYVLGECPLSDKQLFDSMIILSKALGECLDMKPEQMKEHILARYVGNDAITQFNRQNIIVL